MCFVQGGGRSEERVEAAEIPSVCEGESSREAEKKDSHEPAPSGYVRPCSHASNSGERVREKLSQGHTVEKAQRQRTVAGLSCIRSIELILVSRLPSEF